MRPVIQEEATGCAIAAVAAIARCDYATAQRRAATLGIPAGDETLWSETAPIRRLLGSFGCAAAAGETPFRGWALLPELALLAIKWHLQRGRPHWHWVVFRRAADGAVVFDSKKTLKQHARRDFGRMKPKWYIEVQAPQDISAGAM
jgi:hypothetical protein